jgi:hypothetical protein
MDAISLSTRILSAEHLIVEGRVKHFTEGSEADGLREFKDGCAILKDTFTAARASNDLSLILQAEFMFLTAEIAEGSDDEPLAKASAEAGLEVIEDAFRALQAVALGNAYKAVDLAYPLHDKRKWRYKGCPKDAFHVFCESHIARLNNGLKRYGVSPIDRDLIEFRTATIKALEEIYCGMQRKALV